MNTVFSISYRVRSYETDLFSRLKPVSLINYFQDAASSHAGLLGFSVADLLRTNHTWVLSRYQIRVSRYPLEGETVTVRTWRSALDGYHALRDFEALDENGMVVAVASSSWLIIGLDSHRPVRIKAVLDDFPVHDRRVFPDDFISLPKRETYDLTMPFRVRMSDLDQNRHVNHAVYPEWAFETVPTETLNSCQPTEIHIVYRAEAVYGGRVISRSAPVDSSEPGSFLHQLVDESDGKELTRLMTVWRCRENL